MLPGPLDVTWTIHYHSTESALLCIKNEIHTSLAKGIPTALILLVLSTAFDTIDHGTLIDCLSSWFGACGSALY